MRSVKNRAFSLTSFVPITGGADTEVEVVKVVKQLLNNNPVATSINIIFFITLLFNGFIFLLFKDTHRKSPAIMIIPIC